MPDSTTCSGGSSPNRKRHHKRRREGRRNSFLRCALFCAYIFSPSQNEMSISSLISSPITVSDAFMQPLPTHQCRLHRQKNNILLVATEPNIDTDTLQK
eukprot:scaffold31470_cov86-Skeletonema_marinoi.AAC.1